MHLAVGSGAVALIALAPAAAFDHPGPVPVNTAAPVVQGTAQEGQTLQTSDGTWTNQPTSYAYQWLRCDAGGANCAPIADATAQTDGLTGADVGSTIRAQVTASNQFGSATAQSAQTPVVVAAPPPAKCECSRVSIRLAGFNAHGTTTLVGLVSKKEEPAEFWHFVIKGTIECTTGEIADCEGFLKLRSPRLFPPYADFGRQRRTVTCAGPCGAATAFTRELHIRIARSEIESAREAWKSKKPLEKKVRIRVGCRGSRGSLATFTLVFTNGNSFDPARSDQDGDGKPDGKKP
jgi:hypothetical protein